ncbi:MAG: XdhC/CoxI family protein [Saprospiraceae bacterium]
MKEIKSIIAQYDLARSQKKKTALATVVHLEGSSYRRPGARMLIEEGGHLTGAISGGCLEGDALRKALHVIAQNKAMLVTYDTMDDDDSKFGVGLGCNGIIQVLIEPIDQDDSLNPIELLRQVTIKREASVILTLFNLEDKKSFQLGTCLIYRNDHDQSGNVNEIVKTCLEDIHSVQLNKNSVFKEYKTNGIKTTAFIEYVELPVALMIIGAGNDVYPLIDIANVLGWESHVIDGRANYATHDRFASACSILVSKPEKVLEHITVDHRTVFVLMTHNYNYDLAMLTALLQLNTPYIGSLGPKKKLDRMLDEIKNQAIPIPKQALDKIFGPVGLDLGAETAEEIALSIVAEIQVILSNRTAKQLRVSEEFIHSRDELKIIPADQG